MNTITDPQKAKAGYIHDRANESFKYAQIRQNESSDRYRDMMLQCAGFLFGFVVIFSNPADMPLLVKSFLVGGTASLAASIVFGLWNEHILYKFWGSLAERHRLARMEWEDVLINAGSFEHAKEACHALFGSQSSTESPRFAWIAQSFCLGLGVLVLLGALVIETFG